MEDEKRKRAFTDWASGYLNQHHPKGDPVRGKVMAALAVAYAEYFEPMLAGELEPDEEG